MTRPFSEYSRVLITNNRNNKQRDGRREIHIHKSFHFIHFNERPLKLKINQNIIQYGNLKAILKLYLNLL